MPSSASLLPFWSFKSFLTCCLNAEAAKLGLEGAF